eukprot:TRINITY_DN41415_c0_g1_i1.p1 TRINITY_DN41415_c0_g1~~TRINITY_DN41415_c0_g1_i1.p1  ORF type:complete len:154 (+),score=16.18 TRINITY_DN41415_c0_g1_i1:601-1062(+)
MYCIHHRRSHGRSSFSLTSDSAEGAVRSAFSLPSESPASPKDRTTGLGSASATMPIQSRSDWCRSRGLFDETNASSLRDTACKQEPSHSEEQDDAVGMTGMRGLAECLQSHCSIAIPFDESWRPVLEESDLTAFGPLYNVDLGGGETASVIRL